MSEAIDYAPRIAWYHPRRLWRLLLWLAVLGILAWSVTAFGPGIVRRGRILYWQGQCLAYQQPPGTVVPVDAAGVGTAELYNWREAMGVEQPTLLPAVDTYFVFMHERRCAAGARLIVARHMEIDGAYYTDQERLMNFEIWRPGEAYRDPQLVARFSLYDLPLPQPAGAYVATFYAGQPDPDDASAFLVTFELDGVAYTARYRLLLAGDAVELVSVTPPLPPSGVWVPR